MKHTPTPWKTNKHAEIESANNDRCIAMTNHSFALPWTQCEANAAHIVKCVNLHDELVEALKDAYPYITSDALRASIGDLIVKAEAANA